MLQLGYKKFVEDSVKSFAGGVVNDIYCSFLTLKSSPFIKERNQVDQAWFTLGKSMLTLHNYLIVLHLHRNGCQEDTPWFSQGKYFVVPQTKFPLFQSHRDTMKFVVITSSWTCLQRADDLPPSVHALLDCVY